MKQKPPCLGVQAATTRSKMLMPSTVASPLPTVMSPGQATTMSTMATSTPTITSTIQVSAESFHTTLAI